MLSSVFWVVLEKSWKKVMFNMFSSYYHYSPLQQQYRAPDRQQILESTNISDGSQVEVTHHDEDVTSEASATKPPEEKKVPTLLKLNYGVLMFHYFII